MRSILPTPFLLLGLLLACAGLGACTRLADSFVVRPQRTVHLSPGALGLSYREVAFTAEDDVPLHGWWVPGDEDGATMLFLHDASGNLGDRVDLLRHFHEQLGLNMFLFDYRGFGKSDGTASPEAMDLDVRAARDLLQNRGWQGAGLILYGNGLGASLAVRSAVAAPPAALVLEAAFPDLESAVRARHPLLAPVLAPWLRDRMKILGAVRRLQVPVLFLHGERDEEIPIALGWLVYDACPAPKRFRTITGAGHEETAFSGGRLYWSAWARFLEQVFHGPTQGLAGPR